MRKIWLFACFAATLAAADVSGKWSGNIEVEDPGGGETINTQVHADLRQTADAVTGTIGRQGDQAVESIRNARLDGKRFTFEVSSAEANGLVKFALTLEGDRLDGEMSGSLDGAAFTGKVHLSRDH
jgi:hypothetical protein